MLKIEEASLSLGYGGIISIRKFGDTSPVASPMVVG
jgi:hypothetical protein